MLQVNLGVVHAFCNWMDTKLYLHQEPHIPTPNPNPPPCTLHLKPQTLHHAPYTINSGSLTLNHEP